MALAPGAWGEPRFPDWAYHARLADLVLDPSVPDGELDELPEEWAGQGYTAVLVHFDAENGHDSLIDERGFAEYARRLGRLDDACRKRGIRTVWYVNGAEVMTPKAAQDPRRPSLARAHPDWLQVDEQGRPIVFTGLSYDWVTPDMEDAWICPRSPYRDLLASRIRALVERGLDAVWVDAVFLPGVRPREIWGCFCARCEKAYQDAQGKPLPRSPADPDWPRFLAFRHRSIAEHLHALSRAARDAGIFALYETSSIDGAEATVLGNDPTWNARPDLGMAPEIEEEAPADFWRSVRFCRDVSGDVPIWVLHYAKDLPNGLWKLAAVAAHAPAYYPTVESDDEPSLRKLARAGFRRLDRMAEWTKGTAPWATAGLGYSSRLRDADPSGKTGHHGAYLRLAAKWSREHVPYRVFDLDRLDAKADLSALRTFALPEVDRLEPAAEEALRPVPVLVVGRAPANRAGGPVASDAELQDLPFRLEASETSFAEWRRSPDGRTTCVILAHARLPATVKGSGLRAGKVAVDGRAFPVRDGAFSVDCRETTTVIRWED